MGLGVNQKNTLRWMAENPFFCSNSTAMAIAEKVAEDYGGNVMSIYQGLRHLIKRAIVNEEVNSKKQVKGLYINWNCHTLPEEIMKYAPKSVQEAVEETNEKLKSGEYLGIDPYGAGIIQPAEPSDKAELWQKLAEGLGHTTSDDVDDTDVTDITDDDSDIKEPEAKPEPVQVQEVVATEDAVTVEPTVVKTADGKSISISLTINLNL